MQSFPALRQTFVSMICFFYAMSILSGIGVVISSSNRRAGAFNKYTSPIFTTGQLFLHSCRHFFGLHLHGDTGGTF
jgi:hypothetical protein